MKIEVAIKLIETFLEFNRTLFSGSDQLKEIEEELDELPKQVKEYIEQIIPHKQNVKFDLIGAPFILINADELVKELYDFAYEHDLLGASWVGEWLVIGYQGYDAYCVHRYNNDPKVYKFLHNTSFTNEPIPVSESIAQLILCAEAIDFAINSFENSIRMTHDPFSVKLAPASANWLFPKMKIWAGSYYDEWCGVFDNSKDFS